MKWIFNPFTGKLDAVGYYFKENGNNLELWYKGQLLQSWAYDPYLNNVFMDGNNFVFQDGNNFIFREA